jgi:hypothetical protein
MDLELRRIKLIADFISLSNVLETFKVKSIGTTSEQKIIDLIALYCDSVKMVNDLDLERKIIERSLLSEKELNLKLQMDMNRLKLEHESELISIKFENENRVNELEEQLRKLI